MKKLKTCFQLFITFFKIGLFTFGGGYAMIALIENEFVERKKWISSDDFYDLLAIAESTPGPIAINSSTFIGYKMAGFFGSVFSTIAVALPSFIIIYIISLFFDKFLQFSIVANAFKGIQVCVAYLIFSAGIKMIKKLKKKVFNIILLSTTTIAFVLLSFLSMSFSSIYYVLIGAFLGFSLFVITLIANKKSKGEKQ